MTGHRFWRVSNVTTIGNLGLIAAEMVFYDMSGNDFTVGGYAISSGNSADHRGDPNNLFDKNPNTNWLNNYQTMSLPDSWVGYVTPEPHELHSIGLLMRQDYGTYNNDMWRTADVEYSDDGVTWTKQGVIKPLFDSTVPPIKIFEVPNVNLINVFNLGNGENINVYAVGIGGSLSGRVTEGKEGQPKVPITTTVALHDRMTHSLVQITTSDELGNYHFYNLDGKREYYATALHPTRKYNAVIQDGLKSGMTS